MTATDETPPGSSAPAEAPPKGRLYLGVGVFLLGSVGAPLCIPLVTASGLPKAWRATLSGLLGIGIPELAMLAAVAILGKSGYAYVKSRVFAFIKRHGPPAHVSRARYRIGLAMFVAVLAYALVEPYAGRFIPGHTEHRLVFALAGDVLLLISLFVLGGDFWDKIRALFVHEAKAQFPGSETAAAT
jgi:hypothetical protein